MTESSKTLLIKSDNSPGSDYVKVTDEQAEILMKIHNNSLDRAIDERIIQEEMRLQRKMKNNTKTA